MVGIKTDRGAVLVGSPVETKHNYSRLAYSRVGRHGGGMSDEAIASAQFMGGFALHIGELSDKVAMPCQSSGYAVG
jgi:hypothetical protein